MSKQLTPIQKAIEEIDRRYQAGMEITYLSFRDFLEDLLPEEKQFAEKAFDEGMRVEWMGEDERIKFPEYYKQYEDEKGI